MEIYEETFEGITFKLKQEDEKDPEDELDMFMEESKSKDEEKGEASKEKQDTKDEDAKAVNPDDEVGVQDFLIFCQVSMIFKIFQFVADTDSFVRHSMMTVVSEIQFLDIVRHLCLDYGRRKGGFVANG